MRALPLAIAAMLTVAAASADQLVIAGQRFAQSDILDARAVADASGPSILVTMTPSAAKRLRALTAANVGKPVPVSVGEEPLMSPVVMEPITGGSIQISGMASFESAAAIAKRISGKDPLPESLEE